MKLNLFATTILFCVTLAPPTLAHNLKPGLYKIDVRVELPNLNDAATTLSKQICITREMIENHDSFKVLMDTPVASCPRMPICINGSDVGFSVNCPGRRAAHANARFKITNDKFTGTIRMDMGGKNMTVIERQFGNRIGNCAAAN